MPMRGLQKKHGSPIESPIYLPDDIRRYNFEVKVSKGGDGRTWISQWGDTNKGGFQIGPRSALFVVPKE
jgi:hypothetical protein